METMQTARADFSYSDQPPILIGASSEAALSRAAGTVASSGLRIGATMTIEAAAERIARQGSATSVWLEIDRDCGDALDQLLAQVSSDVGAGRYTAVVSGTAPLIDPLAAAIGDERVQVIIDAGEAERVAALAVAVSMPRTGLSLSDVAADQNAARLRQLSDEVSRIAATLARLSTGPGSPAAKPVQLAKEDAPEISAETVRSVIRARRLRARYFPEELFADPAWDMLLDLLQAEIAHLRVPVSSLCIAAAVPATTALRWLKTMVTEGLFVRRADPHDGRRVFVELAPATSQALRRYFAEVGKASAI